MSAIVAAMASSASADNFKLVYTGTFNTHEALNADGSSTAFFRDVTPFTVTAFFDDASPNIVAPVGVPGFVAYAPTLATLSVSGQTYNIESYNQDAIRGVTVAVFDNTTPFGPTHYAVGLLQNPLMDGAGFVGDWVSASPDYSAAHLVSTVFTNYEGVGHGSGPDLGNGPTVVPIPLSDNNGSQFLLTLGNYDEQLARGGVLNTAILTAVPEPGSLAILSGLSISGVGMLLYRRRISSIIKNDRHRF